MSINKFIIIFSKNKPFFWVPRIEKPGFWIFELLVAIVILMLISLFLFRFSCNMIALEADSVNRLMAIDYIASHLDGALVKGVDFRPDMANFGAGGFNFELKSKVSNINIVKSNLPESVTNWQKTSNFNALCVSVSYRSASGKENIVKIFASAPKSGGLHD